MKKIDHLTGRHQGCFLYIGKDVGSPVSEEKAGRTTRVCSEEELRLLSAHGFQLRTAWHRGLR